MTPARILYVINNAEVGGGPQHLAYLLRYLNPTRFHASVTCTGGGRFLDLLRQDQVRVIPVDLMRWYTFPDAVRCLTRIICSEQIDLIHTHGTRAGLIGGLAAHAVKAPCVYTLHATRANRDDRWYVRWAFTRMERRICRLSAFVISVSESNRRFCLEQRLVDEQHIVTIPNGLPPDEWLVHAKSSAWKTPPTVGMIGRLDRQKGVLCFIKAAAKVHRHRPDLRFVVVGDGSWRTRAQSLAQRLDLTDAVRFTGWMTQRGDIFDMIDILVLPSLWEGLPFVALEGMALGKPVIATQVNGLPEAITHGQTGLLVPPGDAHALAETIMALAGDPAQAQRLADAAQTDVRARFNATTMAAETMAVYKRVLQD